jgi:uncharacterized membrane protein
MAKILTLLRRGRTAHLGCRGAWQELVRCFAWGEYVPLQLRDVSSTGGNGGGSNGGGSNGGGSNGGGSNGGGSNGGGSNGGGSNGGGGICQHQQRG